MLKKIYYFLLACFVIYWLIYWQTITAWKRVKPAYPMKQWITAIKNTPVASTNFVGTLDTLEQLATKRKVKDKYYGFILKYIHGKFPSSIHGKKYFSQKVAALLLQEPDNEYDYSIKSNEVLG